MKSIYIFWFQRFFVIIVCVLSASSACGFPQNKQEVEGDFAAAIFVEEIARLVQSSDGEASEIWTIQIGKEEIELLKALEVIFVAMKLPSSPDKMDEIDFRVELVFLDKHVANRLFDQLRVGAEGAQGKGAIEITQSLFSKVLLSKTERRLTIATPEFQNKKMADCICKQCQRSWPGIDRSVSSFVLALNKGGVRWATEALMTLIENQIVNQSLSVILDSTDSLSVKVISEGPLLMTIGFHVKQEGAEKVKKSLEQLVFLVQASVASYLKENSIGEQLLDKAVFELVKSMAINEVEGGALVQLNVNRPEQFKKIVQLLIDQIEVQTE